MTSVSEPIAVIGLAGRFPGACDVTTFAANLRDGVISMAFPSDGDLAAAGVSQDALRDSTYVKAVATAPDIDRFDPAFFGFTAREAQICDPQIRVFLETAHASLENAGYDVDKVHDVGVFGSAGANRYLDLVMPGGGEKLRSTTGMSLSSLNNADYVSSLVSYKLGLRGPSMTVQTACSSSLVTVHLAIQALRAGECELALAGGVDVELPLNHGYWWESGGPLSRDGLCRPFDAQASGTVFGSGAGVVVLKRLSDALADGDTVHAVIRATAVNNDGPAKVGFSAPSVTGQAAVIAEAIALAELSADQIALVEAHGTGTALGDPIEVAALNAAFRRMAAADLLPASCALTSVKGNVGHLGHAAGITSLIRTVIAVRDGWLPANVNLTEPNPKLELDAGPFYLPTKVQPWQSTPERPRIAGVSSLGIGGTNAHAILAEAPVLASEVVEPARPRIVVWSGKTAEAEGAYREALAAHFRTTGSDAGAFAAGVATLQRGRTAHQIRAAVVASTAPEAVAALTDARSAAVIAGDETASARSIVYLFPGQGAQHAAMAADLYEHVPVFAAAVDTCLELFEREGISLRQRWLHGATDDELSSTVVAQPLLFTVEHALATMWRAWGVAPAALLGHSIGELVAATEAGVFTLPDAVRATAARSHAMGRRPGGGMIAVASSIEAVTPLLAETLTIAVVNGAKQVVVAGPSAELDRFRSRAQEARLPIRQLQTSHAFHHPLMADAVGEFEAVLRTMPLRAPDLPLYSASTGCPVEADQATSPAFWAAQLTAPVRFDTALARVLADGPRLLIEVGPGRTLTALARQEMQAAPGRHRAVATLPQRRGDPPADRNSALTAAATVWACGHDIDWAAVDGVERLRRVPVPGYPYQRERYWADAVSPIARPVAATAAHAPVAIKPLTVASWAEAPCPAPADRPDGLVAAVLLPTDRVHARRVTGYLRQAGYRVVGVRTGDSYADNGSTFTVSLDRPADLGAMFRALADRVEPADLVVHAATLGDTGAGLDERLRLGFHTAAELVRQSHVEAPDRRPGLLVLTERSLDVSGSDPLVPGNAALPPLVRTLVDEESGGFARLIDLGPGATDADIVAELRAPVIEPVVALRGDRRWVPSEQPFTAVPGSGAALRRGGVYLITGGLGGLGSTIARALAATGLAPRLVLIGRSGKADEGLLAGLADAGADTLTAACDVTDAAALSALIDRVTEKFGPINGVLHLAGIPGTGLVRHNTVERSSVTFAPKVTGALALAEVFAGRPALDFFTAFSSRAALDGQVGGADYAAANGVLDALVRSGALPARRQLSINWPAWSEVGMALTMLAGENRRSEANREARRWRTTISPRTYPVLDEHRIDGVPVLPGTASLDFVVTAFAAVVEDGLPVRLTDVVFQRPLVATGEQEVDISFQPVPAGWRFALRSAPAASPGGSGTTHVTGTIARVDESPARIDLAELRTALPTVRESAAATARLAFTLGPRWNTVMQVRTSAAEPALRMIELELPGEFAGEAAGHVLHPTLLDGATAYARDVENEPPHAPFMYRLLTVFERLPATVSSRVRRHPTTAADTIVADVDVTAPDGRILVSVQGYMMRRITDTQRLAQGGPGDDEPAPGPVSVGDRGLPPAAGAQLLLDLLGAHTPRQVAVRQFRGGQPVSADAITATPPASDAVPPSAEVPGAETTVTTAGPATIQDRLSALWTDTLGLRNTDPGTSFFDEGGNSLTAVELVSQIRSTFGLELGIGAIFDFPTLGALAAELQRQGAR